MVPNDELLNYVDHDSHSKDDETFVNEVDVLIRTFILNIEQQDEVEECILIQSFLML